MGAMSDWIKWVRDRSADYVPGVIFYWIEPPGRIEASITNIIIRDRILIVECDDAITIPSVGDPYQSGEHRFSFDLRRRITSPVEGTLRISTAFTYDGRKVDILKPDVCRLQIAR